jgi:hypothetical protein
MKKVFLGGTYAESSWRNRMILYLANDGLDYFNPIVDDWTLECQLKEIKERESCDFCLYTITPKMECMYSVAEVIDDSNKRPNKTVMVILREDGKDVFTESQLKSLEAVGQMVIKNGGIVFHDLKEASLYIANKE